MAKLGRQPVFGPHIRLGDVVRLVTSGQFSPGAAGLLYSKIMIIIIGKYCA